MIIEDRLARAADEARGVADSFEAPGIQHGMSLRWHRRLAAGIAVAAVVIAIAVAGVWRIADLLINETEPADTGPGPELMWSPVSNPPELLHVYNMWATDTGFAMASGSEVWTSPDGQTWQDAVATPSALYLNDGSQVIEYGGAWIGMDGTAETPTVLSNISGQWEPTSLPYRYKPDNDLLAAVIRPTLIAGGSTDIVVVGDVTLSPDPEATMRRFAPDVAAAGGTARVNMGAEAIDIADASGAVIASVPFEDIDERFSNGWPTSGTVIWHSDDGVDWEQIDSAEQQPLFLGSDDAGFVLILGDISHVSEIWSSADGAVWKSVSVSDSVLFGNHFALFEGRVIAASSGALTAIDRDGRAEVISTGDVFAEFDPRLSSIASLDAGPYGIIAVTYDSSIPSTPLVALWYSPDGTRWARQGLAEVFGEQGSIKVAVGTDGVLLGHDPSPAAYSELGADYKLWIGAVP